MSVHVDIKPAAPKRPRRAAKPQPVPATEQFSDWEVRAALAVRRLPPKDKEGWTVILEKLAAKREAEAAAARPAPILRLIVGGAR